jgi:Rod binding domain-containing protein
MAQLRAHQSGTVNGSREEACDFTDSVTAPTKTTKTLPNLNLSPETTRLKQAAQDFEAVFLRQMLSSLERTTKVSSQGSNLAGQGTYGSMIVDVVSEAVAKAGGLGLADTLARAMEEQVNAELSQTNTPIDSVMKTQTSNSARRPTFGRDVLSEDERIKAQGLASTAVPKVEIRTSVAPIREPLADRRIR